MNVLSKDQWIDEVYELLCKSHLPETEQRRKNLRGWAETFADCDCKYYEEGLTPKEAFDEEMSAAM